MPFRRWRGLPPVVMLAIACALPALPASGRGHVQDSARRAVRSPKRASIRRRSATRTRSTSAGRSSRSLYTYDYFARPVRMVPNTADGMPQISDGGRTYTVKVKPGIYFASDPAFKGKRRELTAEDYVYSDQADLRSRKIRSYWLYVFRSPSARARRGACAARARPAASTTTRRSRACRRSTAIRCGCASRTRITHSRTGSPTPRCPPVAREVVDAHADAIEPRDGAPGRHRSLPAEGVGARARRSCSKRTWISASRRYPAPGEAATPRDAAIAQGQRRQEAADRRPHRGQRHRGGPAAACSRSTAASSTISQLPSRSPTTCWTKSRLRSEYAKRGITLHRQTEPSLSFVFFNMDDPVVGGYTPEKIALRRAMVMGYDRRV